MYQFTFSTGRLAAVLRRAVAVGRLGLEAVGLLTVLYLSVTLFLDVNVAVKRRAGVASSGRDRPSVSVPATGGDHLAGATPNTPATTSSFEAAVVPATGVTIAVPWGNLGARMVSAGVIDRDKFETLTGSRGGLGAAERELLYGSTAQAITITPENAGTVLNILWAFGLSNKNSILEQGPLSDPRYGGAAGFASTGGWTLARGDAMDHFSAHAFVTLTPAQQQLVERVSQGIYRPCCGNSTYFPDCNHGMAMLGLLELMAASGASEEQMYKTALAVNAYWFPDTYLTMASYLASRGVAWPDVDPKQALGAGFSSAQGFQQIKSQTTPAAPRGGSGCGA